MQIREVEGQVSLFGPDSPSGKTCQTLSSQGNPTAPISRRSSTRSSRLRNRSIQALDLRTGGGGLLGPSWEIDPLWLGLFGPLNSSECPKDAADCSLSQILLGTVPSKYYLTKRACLGILRRADKRGKPLPELLELALKLQAGILPPEYLETFAGIALSAGFLGGAGPSAGGIGYEEEVAPTLKASDSGTNMVPSILCLNDQGGDRMDCSENITGTLRAQEHGHPPLVLFENHGIDSRYTGPLSVAPTMSARYGTGGNNVPLVSENAETICRMIFTRERSDRFQGNEVTSTQSARQYKDATDLVMEVAGLDCRNGKENGDLCGTLQAGTTGSSLNSIHPVRVGLLLRRLVPQECERLMGYPDGWTDLPGASDSARYRALGNSVVINCVEYIMRGIVLAAETP